MTRSRLSTEPPIPFEAISKLERKLGRSLKGWDDCPPLICTGSLAHVDGAWFDVDAVVRVIRVMRVLRHTKGRWARNKQPLEPDPWQVVWIIAPIFGWKNEDGWRIIRTAWDEVPRKQGKSTLASGLAWYLLGADGEPGAEVYAAASNKDQAGIVFGEAKKMGSASPALKGKFTPKADVLTYHNGSVFRVLSRIAEAAHGLNVHGAIVDEVHIHKTRDLIDAIETGTGSREQPLIVFITTADEAREFTIYDEKHSYTRKVAAHIVSDPSFYGVVWAAEESDDPFADETLRKANPGLGTTISLDYLRKEAEKAKVTPSYYPTYARLHLNRRIREQSRFIELAAWDATAGAVDTTALQGRRAWGGLDLAAVSDFSAWALVVDSPKPGVEIDVLCRFWLPEERVSQLAHQLQVPLKRWVRDGWITTTEGDAVDYTAIENQIVRDCGWFDIQRVSFDRMFAGQLTQNVDTRVDGVEIIPVNQTYLGLGSATKELGRLVTTQTLRHGGNPVLRWMIDCLEVRSDGGDNVKPEKPDRFRSSARIDGAQALITGLDGYIRRPQPKTAYAYHA